MLHVKRGVFGIVLCVLSQRHLLNHRFGFALALCDDCKSALIACDEIHAARVNNVAFVIRKQCAAAPLLLMADSALDCAD